MNGHDHRALSRKRPLLYGENPTPRRALAFEDAACAARTACAEKPGIYLIAASEQNTFAICGWQRGAVPETRADAPLRDTYVCV